MSTMEKKPGLTLSFAELERDIESKSLYTVIFVVVVSSLFFIQALRSYVPGVYVAMFHVVFNENIVENLFILLTLIFFILPALTNTICKKIKIERLLIYSIYIVAIARLLLALHLSNLFQTIISGIIITFYVILMSTFLTLWMEHEDKVVPTHKLQIVLFSIFCAFLIDYLIRTIGFTEDISLLPPGIIADYWYITQYLWLVIQIPLTIFCIYFARKYFPKLSLKVDQEKDMKKMISTRYSLIFVGLGMFWFLELNFFLYPHIISLYSNTNYYFNNILSICSLIIIVILILRGKREIFLNIKVIAILNGVMVLSLFLLLFLGKVLTYIASILMSFSLIIMYMNFYFLFIRLALISFKWEKVKTISNGITIGLVFYIIFLVFHIFTTDWAYVIAAFKGFGPLIIILSSIIFSLSTLISIKIALKKGV